MNNSKSISDCEAYCDSNPDIHHCISDCVACQSATYDYILYDCPTSENKKCKEIETEIEFLHGCSVPKHDERESETAKANETTVTRAKARARAKARVIDVKEGFGYHKGDREIQILATTSILLLFLLYVLKNKH